MVNVPVFARIIRQGVAEGAFDPSSPDDTAVILVALFAGSGDALARLVMDRLDGRIPFEAAEQRIAAYEEAIERILGLPAGAFTLIDPHAMHVWFA